MSILSACVFAKETEVSKPDSVQEQVTLEEGQSTARWEYGLGVVLARIPTYRGSNKMLFIPAPFPYIKYQRNNLHIGREGVKSNFLSSPFYQLGLSAGGSLPVRSSSSDTRQGMPGLRPTLEIGPSLSVYPLTSKKSGFNMKVVLPVRKAFTASTSPKSVGTLFTPYLDFEWNVKDALPQWRVGARVVALINSRQNNRYFYDVAPEFVTPTRASYTSSGGYAGHNLTLSFDQRKGAYTWGSFLRRDDLSGAVFRGSPLVRRVVTYSAGAIVTWTIDRSKISPDAEE